jgi:hypothetical protein
MKTLAATFALLCIHVLGFSQNPVFTKLITQFEEQLQKTPREFAFIHTDRDFYNPGDELLYTSYFINQTDTFEVSKVAYIYLADSKGKILQKQIVKIKNRKATNVLVIPKTADNGEYYIGATTAWMQNFDENIFTKKITIKTDASAVTNAKPKKDFEVGFFPESGSLIQNIDQVIAVRSLNSDGTPAIVNGIVKTKAGETLQNFSTNEFGTTNFKINTGDAKELVIECEWQPNKTKKTYNLTVDNNSANITINNRKKLFIKVNSASANAKYLLLGVNNFKIVFKQEVDAANISEAFAINKQLLPAGVTTVLLVNEMGKIEANRQVYVGNNQNTNTTVTVENTPKKAVRKEVNVTFANGQKDINGSVSITNLSEIDSNAVDIVTYSNLVQALGNRLDFPLAVFKNIQNDPSLIDNILLTNGFKKPVQASLIENSSLKIAPEFGLYIAGKITKPSSTTPIKDGKLDLFLINADSSKYIFSEKTNENGEFIFRDINISKQNSIYYTSTKTGNTDKLTEVSFYPHFTDTFKMFRINQQLYNYATAAAINKINPLQQKVKTLEEVKVKAKRTNEYQKMDQLYVSALFENADQSIITEGTQPGLTLWQLLQRNISGINIAMTDSGRQVFFNRFAGLNALSEDGTSPTVQFFLNEQPVSLTEVEGVFIEDIAYMKVFKGGLGFVLGAPSGAIALYTKKGKNTKDWRDKGFIKFEMQGYEPQYKGYNMSYSMPTADATQIDFRPTLYWQGNFALQPNETKAIKFFTDDSKGPWVLRLQGITANNEPIFEQRIIE